MEMCIGIYIVQNDLIKKGKKRQEALKLSEEELMLNNHRCCYWLNKYNCKYKLV